jgi:hypothetical protein
MNQDSCTALLEGAEFHDVSFEFEVCDDRSISVTRLSVRDVTEVGLDVVIV